MRGKHLPGKGVKWQSRIIPAHAGQTAHGAPSPVTVSDHPRACGANETLLRTACAYCGSSPRMRGKLGSQVGGEAPCRIIPAHAGQTRMLWSSRMISPDHPRACGANRIPDAHRSSPSGSSPRMRGKRAHRLGLCGLQRIIPAHAGQTTKPTAAERSAYGSSPRMRGKLRHTLHIVDTDRIIPAHAGQT